MKRQLRTYERALFVKRFVVLVSMTVMIGLFIIGKNNAPVEKNTAFSGSTVVAGK